MSGDDGDDDMAATRPRDDAPYSFWTPQRIAGYGGAGAALLVAPGAIASRYFNGVYPGIGTMSVAGIVSGATFAAWNTLGMFWLGFGGQFWSWSEPLLVVGGYLIPATVWAVAASDIKVGAVAGIPAGAATAYMMANTKSL